MIDIMSIRRSQLLAVGLIICWMIGGCLLTWIVPWHLEHMAKTRWVGSWDSMENTEMLAGYLHSALISTFFGYVCLLGAAVLTGTLVWQRIRRNRKTELTASPGARPYNQQLGDEKTDKSQ
jgi:hypothetical protein